MAWISRFKYGDPDDLEYQKQIIDTFVNSVYVYDDRLVMTYNYKDGTETILLDAVHQAFGSDLASDAPLPAILGKSGVAVFCFWCRRRVALRPVMRGWRPPERHAAGL